MSRVECCSGDERLTASDQFMIPRPRRFLTTVVAVGSLLIASCDALSEQERFVSSCVEDSNTEKMLSDGPNRIDKRRYCECTYGWMKIFATDAKTSVTELASRIKNPTSNPIDFTMALALVRVHQNCLISSLANATEQ